MGNVARVLTLSMLIFVYSDILHAKCRPYYSVDQYVKDVPNFVLGTVSNLLIAPPKGEFGARKTVFKIDVIRVLKGNIKSPELNVEYDWFNQKEPFKTFDQGKVYVFAIREVKGLKAEIDNTTCSPDVTEAEIIKGNLKK